MNKSYAVITAAIKNRKGVVAGSFALAAVHAAVMLLVPYISKHQIEILELKGVCEQNAPGGPVYIFALMTLLLLIVKITGNLLSGMENLYNVIARERLNIETDRIIYDRLKSISPGFFQNPRNRRLLYVLFDIGHLPGAVVEFCKSQSRTIISISAAVPVIAFIDARAIAVLVAANILQFVIVRIRMKRENLFRVYKEKRLADINELKFILRYQYHELVSVSGEESVMPRYWERAREGALLEARQKRISLFYDLVNFIADNIALAAVSFFIGVSVIRGRLSIGDFTMLTMYVSLIQGNLGEVKTAIGEYYRIKSVLGQLGFFMNMKSASSASSASGASRDVLSLRGGIAADGIYFRYPALGSDELEYLGHMIDNLKASGKNMPSWQSDNEIIDEWQRLAREGAKKGTLVLKGLSARFERGKITALIGRNGSGKTTLMRLLMRSYDPERGAVLINNTPVSEIDYSVLKGAFSFVAQQPFTLESYSIRENLLLGCKKVKEAEIKSVLERLDLYSAVRRHKSGLDTLLGDELFLSGGQKQLLAVGRAILQKRPFIILDEGTNQLDAEHELAIMEMLESLKANAAVIIITHRMTTARKADAVHVLDLGRIAESGGHAGLVKSRDGLYRKFWDIQVVD
jgi:ABC-type multidrug transport system fused ATPase/permease subunit